MLVVSTPVIHENVPAKVITALRSYRNHHSDMALILVYDQAGNVIETHEHAGDFKDW